MFPLKLNPKTGLELGLGFRVYRFRFRVSGQGSGFRLQGPLKPERPLEEFSRTLPAFGHVQDSPQILQILQGIRV